MGGEGGGGLVKQNVLGRGGSDRFVSRVFL